MAVVIEHLTKRYGSFTAVDDLSIDVPSGSVFGLLGPNGAGKTTTFKCVLGLARPSAGGARFDGETLTPRTFQRLAYVAERSVLYDWMTVGEHLDAQRRAFERYDGARAGELLQMFAIGRRERVRRLSKGMRTALSVVLAFAIRPDILILDEPTSGLDPLNQRAVLDLIVEAAARGCTVLFSSHQIGQVERAAQHIAVLDRGRLVLSGAVNELKGAAGLSLEEIFVNAVAGARSADLPVSA